MEVQLKEYFYYSQDGLIFSNRIQAIEYKIKTKKEIYFYYNDDFWSKLNWKVEPEGSLDFHYKMQAQRIRDEYDYVILCYSGGYDSTNILETFHYNNIKLDKILITGAFSKDQQKPSDINHNGEIYLNAFPCIKELDLEKITQVFDYSDMYSDVTQFSLYKLEETWVEKIGSRCSPHHFFWRDMDKYIVPKEFENKKVAILFGIDKPYLIENNTFYFNDLAATAYGNYNREKNNVDVIPFYWDTKYPLILLKQLHFLKNNPLLQYDQDSVAHAVYNLKNQLSFKSGKSNNPLLAKRDTFFLKQKDTKLYDFYTHSIKRINSSEFIKEIKMIKTKKYAII